MSGYIGTQPVPQATQTRDAFTATAGQTSFATSGYTPSFLDVFLNGIKLAAADYTASNGSDVVLASGAATGDILEVVAYTTFEVVTDTLTNAGTVLNLDRTGSDGTILDLKKGGSTVGSIGAFNGYSYIGKGDTTLMMVDAVDAIYPRGVNGGSNDAAISLGDDGDRFKDLYLSGGVYLGGTGSANKLDDYEEGTWTPTLPAGGSLAPSTAFYTKIGELVTCYCYSAFTPTNNSSGFEIGGLPFSRDAGSGYYGSGHGIAYSGGLVTSNWSAPLINASSNVYFHLLDTGGPDVKNSAFGGNQHPLIFSITYRTS